MGLRISIGAIIVVLLGGTGYFAQQSQTTKNLLQQRESELSAEKESSAKLKKDILRFETIDKKMKGLESRLAKEVASAKTRMKELGKLVEEKNATILQDKAKLLALATALKENQTTLENERKARAEEMKRLEAQAKETSRLITEKNTAIKLEKSKIRNLKVSLDILNGSLENERKARAAAENSNKQNTELAVGRAEEIKRLETQAKEASRLIAEKSADIEREQEKNQKLEITLKRIQASLKSDKKTQAIVDRLSKQTLEFAAERAREIKRLESVRGILEAQVQRMDRTYRIRAEKSEKKRGHRSTQNGIDKSKGESAQW